MARVIVSDPPRDRLHDRVVIRVFPRLEVVVVHPENVVEVFVAAAKIAAEFPALLGAVLEHGLQRSTIKACGESPVMRNGAAFSSTRYRPLALTFSGFARDQFAVASPPHGRGTRETSE
jgi:hypothetical protein